MAYLEGRTPEAQAPGSPAGFMPGPVPVRVQRLAVLFAWAVGLILFLHFFPAARLILLTLLAAACLAAALKPLSRHIPGPDWLSALVVSLTPLIALAGVVWLLARLLAERVRAQMQSWPDIEQRIDRLLSDWTGRVGLDDRLSLRMIATDLRGLVGLDGDVFSKTAGAISGLFVVGMLVFFGTLYLLTDRRGRLHQGFASLFPLARRPQLDAALADLEPRLRWWLIGTFISMSVVGAASWAGYTLIGLQLAVPLAIFAALAELVPTIGPAVSFVLALLFALTQGTTQVLGVAGVYLVIQLLESYLLLPLVMKKAVDVPPLVTLFTIVLWGKVLGAGGLLLALPLDLLIWTVADHFLIRAHEQRPPPPAETGQLSASESHTASPRAEPSARACSSAVP